MLEPQQQMSECNPESLWAQRGTRTLHPDVALVSLTSSSHSARPIFQKPPFPSSAIKVQSPTSHPRDCIQSQRGLLF